MMAAIRAAQNGCQVTLLDKNEKTGKKLFITGKGRCNVTNTADWENLFSNVVTNEKFLYSAVSAFDKDAVMDFLRKAGCPLKVERGGRVFPESDHSSDVIAAFNRELKKAQVTVLLHTEAEKLLYTEDKTAVAGVLLKGGKKLPADRVIVATGGMSYASTGSTGDGYRFAEESGHEVEPPLPALVPFRAKEDWCRDLMGLALKNVAVKLVLDQKEIYDGFGEMLFTHFGVSGPLILSASSFYMKEVRRRMRKGKNDRVVMPEAMLYLDLKPALTKEQLDRRLIREFEENKKKQFQNALAGLFPARLIPVMVKLSGVDPLKKAGEITRKEREGFLEKIKCLPITITGVRDFAEAIITMGGVRVKEINPSTMESRKVKGLYFAGEVLDTDALTGGFNLQIAWSTGFLAGDSCGDESTAKFQQKIPGK